MKRLASALAAAALLAGCNLRFVGTHDADREEEKPVPEKALVLPPYPSSADLLEFGAGPTGSHRFFIDARSLDVGADGVVRYALVVRAAGGATSASFEGIRCKSREKRVYAVGHPQGKWIEARRSVWEPIAVGIGSEHHAVLYNDYFCRGRLTVANREIALHALRSGRYGGPRAPY